MTEYFAARQGDPTTHDGIPSGQIGPPCSAETTTVLIEGAPAAHVNCTVLCSGLSGGIKVHDPGVPIPAIVPTDIPTPANMKTRQEPAAAPLCVDGEPDPYPKQKRFQIKLNWANVIFGTLPFATAKVGIFSFEIADLEACKKASYWVIVRGLAKGWGMPAGAEVYSGGTWHPFKAPWDMEVDDFGGPIDIISLGVYGSASQGVGYVRLLFGVLPGSWGMANRITIRKFNMGDFGQMSVTDATILGGDLSLRPWSTTDLTEDDGLTCGPLPFTSTIKTGSKTVLIDGEAGARWMFTGDPATRDGAQCGAMLGDPTQLGRRSVLMG